MKTRKVNLKNQTKMKKMNQWLVLGMALTLVMQSCKKDDPQPTTITAAGAYESGVFVACQGPFSTGSGTVSFYNRSTGAVSNDIFQSANTFPLGNIVQSVNIYNGKGYAVVNNAGKIEVVTANDFKSVGTITGLNSPRYFLGITSAKAYVSEWGTTVGAVRVIDLSNNSISSTINVGNGAENMVMVNSNVFITNSGGFGNDSTVTVINSTTDAVVTTINVGPNPGSIKVDANGKIWVLCGGQWNSGFSTLEKTGKLVRINPSNYSIEQTFTFSSTSSMPSSLAINSAKNKLFYSYEGKVYEQDITAANLSTTGFIDRSFYGLGVDPSNDYLYAADAGNFSSNGKVIRYNSSTGSKVDSFAVGIIPGDFFFR